MPYRQHCLQHSSNNEYESFALETVKEITKIPQIYHLCFSYCTNYENFILVTQNNPLYSQETRLIKEKYSNQACVIQFCDSTSCSQHRTGMASSRDTSQVLHASVIAALQLL